MQKTYFVYIHITPDNMVYVGVTTNPKNRWRPYHYKDTALGPYINKYGWKNIEHKVLFTFHIRKYALKMEDLLICFFRKKGLCINSKRSGLIEVENKLEYDAKLHRKKREENPELHRQKAREYRAKNVEVMRAKEKKYRSQIEWILYDRVKAFNRKHPDKITITPLQAKQDYLNFGIIPDFIKNDDIPPRQISA